MGLIQTGLGIASDILGKCGEDKAKAIVDAISDALPHWLAIGSLVERELAAGRLTEGLTRKISHQSRYLQPLRHGAKRRATSPYTGEASAEPDTRFHSRRALPPSSAPAAQ